MEKAVGEEEVTSNNSKVEELTKNKPTEINVVSETENINFSQT